MKNKTLHFLCDSRHFLKDLVELFKVSKTMWYDALEEGKIMYFTISSRKIILTRSLLPFLREALSMKD